MQVAAHFLLRRVAISGRDRRGDLAMVGDDLAEEAGAERRAAQVRLQDREDRLGGDQQQGVSTGLDDRRVKALVVDELVLDAEVARVLWDRALDRLELGLRVALRGQARSGHLEVLAKLEELVKRHALG